MIIHLHNATLAAMQADPESIGYWIATIYQMAASL